MIIYENPINVPASLDEKIGLFLKIKYRQIPTTA